MIKKILTFFLISILVFCLTACKKDTANVENTIETETQYTEIKDSEVNIAEKTDEVKVTPPKSFTVVDENDENLFYSEDYPDDTACFNMFYADNDPVTFNYTEESYKEQIESMMESYLNTDIEFNVTEFTSSELKGHQVRIIRSNYAIGNQKIYQIQCAVQMGEGCETITYTQGAGDKWTKEFEESLKSISILSK